MKHLIKLTLLIFLISCSKVPIAVRRQLNMLPESQLMAMSLTEYKIFLSENETVTTSSSDDAAMVKRVGNKIARAVESNLKKHVQIKRVKDFNWEFNLVNDATINAWCMPSRKVVFYTGILPITQDKKGLAVVMGHEIAHAIARHGNERMSQGLALQGGGIALSLALSDKPQMTQELFQQAYGLGSQVGMLKYSRMHETESDKMGLVFMDMVGYDPREAPTFWERMAAKGGQNPHEFLSTHPHDDTRIKDLNEFMPEALKYYKPS